MGKDLAEALPGRARGVRRRRRGRWAPALARSASTARPTSSTLTHNAQPALLAHGAAVWAVVRERVGPSVVAAAGHSLGEFTAYHAADALPLRRRGRASCAAAAS